MRRMLVGLAIALLALTGCSVSAGSYKAISKDKLGTLVSDSLTKSVGQRPDNVTCPNDLPTTVGATTRCTLTAGNTRYGVTARVTNVPNPDLPETADIAVEVDQQPM